VRRPELQKERRTALATLNPAHTPSPFMMTMEKGKLLKAATPIPAAKKPVHKPASN